MSKQIIMWVCPSCKEPNSCNGKECPYCNCKSDKFEQEIFIVMGDWINGKAKLIDKAIRKIKKDRWLYKIPDKCWYDLCDIEKNFLFKIQNEIDVRDRVKERITIKQ